MHPGTPPPPDVAAPRAAHGSTAGTATDALTVLAALRRWKEGDRRIAERTRAHFGIGETDLHALRHLIAAHSRGRPASAGEMTAALGISPAATTKLLDRMERSGHLHRRPHPEDRRRQSIEIDETTRLDALETIGRQHARRIAVAAELTADEQQTIIRFLDRLSIADAPDAYTAALDARPPTPSPPVPSPPGGFA